MRFHNLKDLPNTYDNHGSYELIGVYYDFESIPDVVQAHENSYYLIQLYNDGEEFQTLHISKKGPATIQAADIICPEAVEVVDPEQVICTLEKGASLEMEIYAVTGTGYKSSIENKVSYDFGEDVVVLDATFTPIRKADYLSEPARVGLDKKYDKVHINVETDGTITPLQAITMAAKVCKT